MAELEKPQASTEASTAGAPAGSGDGKAAAKPSRIQEFLGTLKDPAEVAEFRKHVRELGEPDFKAQDAKHQKRYADERKRANDAEAALRDLADPDILSRYQAEQGSLEKAKDRAVKNSRLPAYVAKRIRTFDDLWEAEDDFAKNATPAGRSAGEPAAAETEDAEFIARLQRLGVPVQASTNGKGNEPIGRGRTAGSGGGGVDDYASHVRSGKAMPSAAEIDQMTAGFVNQ